MSFERTHVKGSTGTYAKREMYTDSTHSLVLTYPHDPALPLDIMLVTRTETATPVADPSQEQLASRVTQLETELAEAHKELAAVAAVIGQARDNIAMQVVPKTGPRVKGKQ